MDDLETLSIDVETPDKSKRGWNQVKIIFREEDRNTLQTLVNNNSITEEIQHTPKLLLDAIETSKKKSIFGTTGIN